MKKFSIAILPVLFISRVQADVTFNVPIGLTQIQAASLPLPYGAATESTLGTLNGKFSTSASGIKVDGSAVTQPVSGPITDAQMRATPVPSQNYYRDSESGAVTQQAGVDGAASVIDYLDSIGTGKIVGHELFRAFGQRTSLATTVSGDDVWEGAATTIPLPDQAVGEHMTIVSTSNSDASAGTGTKTLDVHYLDASGVAMSEIVALSGVTPVNTVATNIRFVNSIHTNSVGSAGVTQGTITIYKVGAASTVYAQLNPGGNMTLSSLRMVPLGKTFYMKDQTVCGTSGKAISARLRATSTFEDVLTSGFFLYKNVGYVLNSCTTETFALPLKFPALTIIKGTAYSAQAGGDISFSYDGWIE